MITFETDSAALTMTCWNGSLTVDDERDDALTVAVSGRVPMRLRFTKRTGEHLVGLGERFVRIEQTGRMYEGRIADLLDGAGPEDSYHYVPVIYSSAGYAVLVDSDCQATWDLGASDASRWSVWLPVDEVRVHVFRGTPRQTVSAVTSRTGRAPLAEPWVYGVWKTGLSGTDAVLRQADEIAKAGIPVTAMWTYDYFDGEINSGCHLPGTYPGGEYRDLRALTAGLHDRGLRALGYLQSTVIRGTAAFDHAMSQGYLIRRPDGEPYAIDWWFDPIVTRGVFGPIAEAGVPVDFTNPDASAWYSSLVAAHLDLGFDGWMEDFGEQTPLDAVFADGSTGFEMKNRYTTLYHKASYEGWSPHGPAATFSRSGSLGSAPYQPILWAGDQFTDWTPSRGLRSVIPAGPSAGLTGVSAWGADIFGLTDRWDGGAGALDEELWIRACQFGALSPIMRDHLGYKFVSRQPVDMWTSARTVETFAVCARLHLSLHPYLWGLAQEASATGIPIMRPMFLEYPDHDDAWISDDQYLLGTDLLVAPVHEPGAETRTLWLPPGEWVDWWGGDRYGGPGVVTVPAPLDRIPLFQRGGSSIPLRRVVDGRLEDVDTAPVEQRSV